LLLLCHIVLLLFLVFDHFCRKKNISFLAHPIHLAISVLSAPRWSILLNWIRAQFHSFLVSVDYHRQYRFRLG
jgi:hypothetical protein